jgi:lysophospholipase L1-like esterase
MRSHTIALRCLAFFCCNGLLACGTEGPPDAGTSMSGIGGTSRSGSAGSGGLPGGSGGTIGSGGMADNFGSGGSGGLSNTAGAGGIGTGGTGGALTGRAGAGGTSGTTGDGGTSGRTGGGGTSGTTGRGGTSGATGSGGLSGAAGTGGKPGIAGTSGTAGTTGAGGSSGTAVPLDPSLLSLCTGVNPISCTIPVPANGNYNVTVELGSATAAASTRVQAETWRIELQPTATAAGAFFQYTFTVNVRQEVHNVYSAPGKVLNLLFDGAAPALHGLGFAVAQSSTTLFVAGDSTVCDWDPSASDAITPPTPSIERGWAQELSQYLAAPGFAVANYAVSGQTAGSFYSSYFPAARTAMKAGDYLFIQFGHNDQKSAADIAAYQANLMKYIADARSHNVTPVLFTPVARGTGVDFAGLDQQARDLAAAQNVALIDLTNLAWSYYKTLPDKSVLFVPGQETHFSESGATQIASIVVQALKTSGLGLVSFFK